MNALDSHEGIRSRGGDGDGDGLARDWRGAVYYVLATGSGVRWWGLGSCGPGEVCEVR
jgi:hypothetical protein